MRNEKIVLSLITLNIFLLFLLGCATPNPKNPINVSDKNFPEFGVGKIKSSMNPWKKIGGLYDFPFHKTDTHYAGAMSPETSLKGYPTFLQMYTEAVKRELRNAGYEASEDKPRFLFEGTILRAKIDGVLWVKEYSFSASIRVKWEVCDQEKSEIIYSKNTSGNVVSQKIDISAIISAFTNSFHDFLASKDLVDSIEKHLANWKSY